MNSYIDFVARIGEVFDGMMHDISPGLVSPGLIRVLENDQQQDLIPRFKKILEIAKCDSAVIWINYLSG